jgi:hypothetical protein
VDRFAPAADEAGEIADPRRQHGLDEFAHPARHHRRGTAGTHGHHHVTAIDDGGKNEGRMCQVIHHVYGKADRLRPRRHRRPDIAGARAEDCNDAAEIGGQRIISGKFDPRRIGGPKAAHIVIAVGGVPANMRARRGQQAQFRPRQVAGTHQQYRTGS